MSARRSYEPTHLKPAARRPLRARVFAAAIVLALVGVGGIALAYWHASGSGTGSAATATAAAVTLSPGTSALTLYPGGHVDVALTVANSNTTALIMGSLALDSTQGASGFAVDAAHAACATSTLSFSPQTNAGAGWNVPAMVGTTNGTLAITLPDALHMSVDAANACQGAQFTVYMVAGS
jgi:ferric-dicitrate binding protein FerR (iron transport regulator)